MLHLPVERGITFNKNYPALSSAFGAFCDSPAHDDEKLAREVYTGDPAEVRAGLIAAALADWCRFSGAGTARLVLVRKNRNDPWRMRSWYDRSEF